MTLLAVGVSITVVLLVGFGFFFTASTGGFLSSGSRRRRSRVVRSRPSGSRGALKKIQCCGAGVGPWLVLLCCRVVMALGCGVLGLLHAGDGLRRSTCRRLGWAMGSLGLWGILGDVKSVCAS